MLLFTTIRQLNIFEYISLLLLQEERLKISILRLVRFSRYSWSENIVASHREEFGRSFWNIDNLVRYWNLLRPIIDQRIGMRLYISLGDRNRKSSLYSIFLYSYESRIGIFGYLYFVARPKVSVFQADYSILTEDESMLLLNVTWRD